MSNNTTQNRLLYDWVNQIIILIFVAIATVLRIVPQIAVYEELFYLGLIVCLCGFVRIVYILLCSRKSNENKDVFPSKFGFILSKINSILIGLFFGIMFLQLLLNYIL